MEGTLLATSITIGTEVVLAQDTGKASFQAYLDTENMQAGDEIEIKLSAQIITGGALKTLVKQTFTYEQLQAIGSNVFPLPVHVEVDQTVQLAMTQLTGTPRDYDWRLSNISRAR